MVKTPPSKKAPSTPDRKKSKARSMGRRVTTPDKSKAQKLDGFQTQAPGVAVMIASKPKDEPTASFIYPMEKAFNDPVDGLKLDDDPNWSGVLMFAPRRGNEDGTTTKKTGPTYVWDWKCIVMVEKDDNDSVSMMAKRLAKAFTAFTKSKKSGMNTPEPYDFRSAFTSDPKPLNYHLLDIDCARVLRSLYENYTREELAEDEDLMNGYFGGAEDGKNFLESLDEDEFEDLLG